MSKQELLDLIKLLSALESWTFSGSSSLPDHLYNKIDESMAILEQEILKP